jgi:hypothetical protein
LFAQHLQRALAAQAPPIEISAYPNPFSSKANITFALERGGAYTIDLYDLKGALVKKIAQGTATSQGAVTVEVDGTSLSKGIYLARLQTEEGGSADCETGTG